MRIDTITPKARVSKSQGAVLENNLTYNQEGYSYNQVGIQYGGFYGLTDVVPTISITFAPKPTVSRYADIYSPGININLLRGMPVGPGFFLFITYPQAISLIGHV